jgi:hypothetical protein
MGQGVKHKDVSELPLFFIIGRPRSGTTLLRMLFEAHPNALVPPESPFIIILYKKYQHIRNWDEPTIREFVNDIFKVRYFDKWLIDKESLVNGLLEIKGERTFQEIVKQVCLSYQSLYDKQEILMLGDKNPAYSLHIHHIHRLFPQAKIIHITRDYRDNYLSLTNVNFEVPIVPLVIYRWKFNMKLAMKLKERCPEMVCRIRYEDLASRPEEEFGKICRFLGIDFDPKVMSFYEKKEEAGRAYASADDLLVVHKSLFNPISTDRMNLWKKEMKPRDIRIADLVAGKMADKAGYQRQYPKFNLGLYLWIMPTLIYASLMYRMILFGEKLPYSLRNKLGQFLGIFLKVYWKINKRKVKPL